MKAKAVTNFIAQFGIDIALNPELTVEKSGRFYLVNAALKPLMVRSDYFYAGVFLGKAKEGKFFPSFNLLAMIAKKMPPESSWGARRRGSLSVADRFLRKVFCGFLARERRIRMF